MAFGGCGGPLVFCGGALAGGLLALEGTLCLLSADRSEVFSISGGQVAVLRSPDSVDRRAAPVQSCIGCVETVGLFALFGFSVSPFDHPIPSFGGEVPLKCPRMYRRRLFVLVGLALVGERVALISDSIPLVRYSIAFIRSALSLVSQDIPSVCYDRRLGHLFVTPGHTCHVMPPVSDF